MTLKRTSAAMLAVLAMGALAAPASAQQDPTSDAARRAESLDRLLGANADLPKPDAAAGPLVWMAPPLPPWLAAQPYRQQPLFTTVPVGGTVRGGRVRGSGVP